MKPSSTRFDAKASSVLSQVPTTAFTNADQLSSPQQRIIDGHPQPLWLEEDESTESLQQQVAHGDDGDAGPHDPAATISPLFALGAFGIATALVAATAGVAAVGIARAMDVRDVSLFVSRVLIRGD